MDTDARTAATRTSQHISEAVNGGSHSTVGQIAQGLSEPMERGLAGEPANSLIRTLCLIGTGGSIVTSLIMQMQGKKNEALFVGQWAPTFIGIALWYQIVKSRP